MSIMRRTSRDILLRSFDKDWHGYGVFGSFAAVHDNLTAVCEVHVMSRHVKWACAARNAWILVQVSKQFSVLTPLHAEPGTESTLEAAHEAIVKLSDMCTSSGVCAVKL
jgi:hypothetical protein